MANFRKFHQFIEDVFQGVHDLSGDTLKVALTNAEPSVTDSVLADISQIDYTNLSSRTLSGVSAEQTGGVLHLTADPLTITASGTVPTFRHIVVYNDTAASKPLICFFSHVADIALSNLDEFLIDIPTDLFTAE